MMKPYIGKVTANDLVYQRVDNQGAKRYFGSVVVDGNVVKGDFMGVENNLDKMIVGDNIQITRYPQHMVENFGIIYVMKINRRSKTKC